MSKRKGNTEDIYEIQVLGELDVGWQDWFNGLEVALTHSSRQSPITTMIGRVADQAALRGIVCKLWDLNLTLISLRRVDTDRDEENTNE